MKYLDQFVNGLLFGSGFIAAAFLIAKFSGFRFCG